jgi:peptide-methionine (R)-S-oxide reductase
MIRHEVWMWSLVLSGIVGCRDVVATQPASPPATAKEDSSAEKKEMPEKVIRTEKEWRKLLSREQYRVLRLKGTEPPFRNKYDKHFDEGTYVCAACGQELFDSDTKFNSGCGWPAFYAAKAGDRVKLTPDVSLGMIRTEVTCARCDSHLGHIFADAPQTPTGQRYCINSISLIFKPKHEKEDQQKRPASSSDDEEAATPPKTDDAPADDP